MYVKEKAYSRYGSLPDGGFCVFYVCECVWRVDEIEMAYIAVPIEGTNDARLLPVWRFQTEHTMEYAGKDDPSQTTTLTDRGDILFNALDGTELFKNNGSI